MSNRSSPTQLKSLRCTQSKKKTSNPVTPERRISGQKKPSTELRGLYHSPDSITLRLPGTESPQPASPSSLFHSPQQLWKTLRCSPSSDETKNQSRIARRNGSGKENDWSDDFLDQITFGCGAMACPSSTTPFTARLTQDMLHQHDSLARKLPGRKCNFSGDKLAKTVIDKKAQFQLLKERKEQAQQELESRMAIPPPPTLPKIEGDIKTKRWIELERQKALAAIWKRKKNAQWESMRAEQLRLAELERQRHLRAIELNLLPSTPKKERPTKTFEPGTPKTQHSSKRKLIHI